MKKIGNWIKENKWLLLSCTLVFGIFFYCIINAPLASDDYPYSLFYRGGARITHLSQILANQMSDYMHITGRIVTNGLGQFLLMFDRSIFSILNSLVIVITFLLMIQLIKIYRPITKKQQIILFFLCAFLFLTMDKVKYLVYWTMGAANYIWMMPFILLFLIYHGKHGLWKHPILEAVYVGLVASFHESLLVFFIIFILGHFFYDLWKKKKIEKRYLYYLIALLLASGFIFISPGNRSRNASWYPAWNQLNFLEKLNLSIPTVAYNMFHFDLFNNPLPFIFTLVILFMIGKEKSKLSKAVFIINILLLLVAILTKNGWVYLIFSAILFFSECYLHENSDNKLLSLASLGFYAIVYSMIITPEYGAGRPNYFMYCYMIVMIAYFVIPFLNKKRIEIVCSIIIALLFIGYGIREIAIYNKIGQVVEKRNIAIQKAKEENSDILYFERMPKSVTKYQIEANAPGESGYWAHQYFCTYYGLKKDIKIELITTK